MTGEGEQFCTATGIPDYGRIVPTGGDDACAIRAEGREVKPGKGEQLCAATGIPDFGCIIGTDGDDALPVRAEGR